MWWFIKRILKLDSPITVGQWFYDRLTGNGLALLALFGGGSMSYLASLTKWVAPWGPLGWGLLGVFVALTIFLAVSLAAYIVAGTRDRFAHAEYVRSLKDNPKSINPLRDSFDKEKILLSDFFSPYQLNYKKKVFRSCDIYGPAVIYVESGTFDECGFYSCDFIVTVAGHVNACVWFEGSQFYGCRLYGVSILVTKDFVENMAHDYKRRGIPLPSFLGMGGPTPNLKIN